MELTERQWVLLQQVLLFYSQALHRRTLRADPRGMPWDHAADGPGPSPAEVDRLTAVLATQYRKTT